MYIWWSLGLDVTWPFPLAAGPARVRLRSGSGAGQAAYSLTHSSSHWRRSFYFIYGRLEVRPQFRMRPWLDNYTLVAAEKGRGFILNMNNSHDTLGNYIPNDW